MDNTNPLEFDVKKKLLELAQAEKKVGDLQQTVNTIETRHAAEIAEPKRQLEDARSRVLALRQVIVASERLHVLGTGEKKESGAFASRDPHITIKRQPARFIYDDAEMLKAIQSRKGKDGTQARKNFLRIKTELNKVALNKYMGTEEYNWLPAEQASGDVTVVIEPLGDLLIQAEVEAKKAAEAAAIPPVVETGIPDYVVKELRKMVADGYNIRKSDHVLDLVDAKTARWINANIARYADAVAVAIKPQRQPV